MNSIIPRPEYPRPDFKRTDWLNLNGEWEFDFDDADAGEKEYWYKDKNLTKRILVPFCFQSEMSGIHDTGMHEIIWYKRNFDLPKEFKNKRVLLNFGAVDYFTKVWVNGEYVGSHKGGNISFKMDISSFLKEAGNSIAVRVEDRYETVQPRGKQYWLEKPDRCWYTSTSGIWQTVWLEAAGEVFIDKIRLTPDIDRKVVLAEVFLDKKPIQPMDMKITLGFQGSQGMKQSFFGKYLPEGEEAYHTRNFQFNVNERIMRFTLDIQNVDDIDDIHLWSPERPNLYDINFCLAENENTIDQVGSYFGMRKISIDGDKILLNNHIYYQKLILDQGYWPQSLLTPPSDEAIIFDLEMTKSMGFNGARKHQKMEDPRYYYWADKLGLLVWGEMPSAYNFNAEEAENITKEWIDFINRDYNHPCIVTWVPLNESWGVRNIYSDKNQQNFAKGLYYLTKGLDATRLVSTNDGWELVDADICAIHDYTAWGEDFTKVYTNKEKLLSGEKKGRQIYSQGTKYEGQPVLLTEYGGIAFVNTDKENWGYGGGVKDEAAFFERYFSITNAVKGIPYIKGYCYTQLTDVMQEINGLLTADRKLKVNLEEIRKVNA